MPVAVAELLPIALAVRAGVIVLTLLTARRRPLARQVAFLGSVIASVLTGLVAMDVLRSGSAVGGVLFLHDASGLSLTYSVDGLGAWFLGVLSLLAIPIAVFSIGYTAHPPFERRSVFVGTAFNILLGAVELIFAASDVITFLCAWEAMTLVTAALVATEHEKGEARSAAFLYLALSHIATGCLIAGFMALASASGSLAFSVMFSGHVPHGAFRHGLFALFFFGFAVKAGVIPLHVWLPEAHPAAPSNISALMSSVMIKTGIYGIVRACVFGLGVPSFSWGALVIVLGGLSAVLGVLYALVQHDLKRLLAYHSIENIGIILLGLGVGMIGMADGRPGLAMVGVAAGLYHVLNHAVFKGLLFLGAGGVVVATGTRHIEHYGGLMRRMPWTATFFLIGALAISGLPPLNGFVSEWLTFQAFLFGFIGSAAPAIYLLFPVGGALLALTAALASACFVKAFGISFLALPRSRASAEARESPAVMLLPQAVLAVLCVVLGLFPGWVLRVLDGVMAPVPGLRSPAHLEGGILAVTPGLAAFDHLVPMFFFGTLLLGLIAAVLLATRRRVARRPVPTWGCGGELTARTEYTATAFSKPLMMMFQGVYRPTRHVDALSEVSPYFPREVRYSAQIEPTFERFVYGPLLRAVMRLADGMKVLQAGSLHAYLAYVIALVVGLVLMVWWRS